jgi:ankyrin repeat protein
MSKPRQTAKDNGAAFFKAANKGEIPKLKALLDAGQKVDARDGTGKTALMRAAERGHIETVRILLASGADASASVSDRDSIWFGCNALIFAAQSGNTELVELLINAGALPRDAATDGNTPLSFAIERQSPRMVEALLKAGAPLTDDTLVTSVWNANAEVSQLLIAAGAKVNASDDLGQSVLHRAAEKGHLEIMRALVRAKAKLNQKANGSTPLLVAIQNGHAECALELIQAGADLSVIGLSRRDALMNAAATGQAEVVRALLKTGANPNTKDKEGKTALMLANEKEQVAVIELLRGSGGDESGYRVQEYIRAAMKGDVKSVREFLETGVDVNAAYSNGAKALISAVRNGHTEVVALLLEWGAKASTTSAAKAWGTEFHADALALAAEGGHLDIVRLLIKARADVKKSRMFGVSALNAAAMGGHAEVIRELLSAGCPTKGSDALEALNRTVRRKKEDAALVLVEAGVKPRGKEAANLLVSAAEKGMARLVKALLAAGVDPKLRNEYDEAALQAAKAGGHKAIVALLEKAKSPQASPGMELVEAAERGDLKTVHRLILEGVDLEARDAKGATALIRASANGHLAVMKVLISAGANPNASTQFAKRDKKKWFHHMDLTSESPLSSAVSARRLPAVEMLLDAGADIRQTECGHIACMILQEGTKEGAALVERLLDAGMEPDARWPEINVSALEIAAQEGFTNLVEKLIRAGARLRRPIERDRAIIDAIEKERAEVARMLIEHAVAPHVKGPITAEALVTAAAAGLNEIVRLLLEQGVKVDRRIDTSFEGEGSVEGVTALMAAARHGRISTVEILLSAGANPNTEDAVRRTAVDWAQDNKSKNVAQRIRRLLEAAGAKE